MTAPGTIEVLPYLQHALTSGQTSAVMTQNADGTWAISVDVGPGASYLTLSPLQGPPGDAGVNQFPLTLMPDTYDTPADLPAPGVLTNTEADIGKYWMISILDEEGGCTSTGAYIWFGSEFRFLPFGSQGPPGPYPYIVPFVNLPGPNHATRPVVTGTGTQADPFLWTLQLSVPTGPEGPSWPLAKMPDVNESVPPVIGQYLTATAGLVDVDAEELTVWSPEFVGQFVPKVYTVPRSAFTSQFGITWESVTTIAQFTVPAVGFPWKPIVFGQILMFQLELSLTPLMIGIEIRLGSPTGQTIAKGFGNTLSGVVNIFPHCSLPKTGTPSTPSTAWNSGPSDAVAMTPSNSVGLVAADATGADSTLYVCLINDDSLGGIYDYNAADSELFVMACPSTQPAALRRGINASLPFKVTLSATSIHLKQYVHAHLTGQGALTN